MGEFFPDLRYAVRLYRRSPGFPTVTTLLIALGIAANTVIFSVVDALLLRPLPVSHPEELVRPVHYQPGLGLRSEFFYSLYTAVKDRAARSGTQAHGASPGAARRGTRSDHLARGHARDRLQIDDRTARPAG